MDKENGPISWLKKHLSNEPSDKKSGKYQYLVIVLLFGAAIMLISNILMKENTTSTSLPVFNNQSGNDKIEEDVETFGQSKSQNNQMISDYENKYENQLKDALEGILGVGEVTIVVNVDSTEKRVLEKNTTTQTQRTDEIDREGGKRKVEDSSTEQQPVIIRNGEKEVPLVVETKKPEIRGVLVVAKGADNIQVKSWIIEAVTRVLGVPSHRVAVMPKKN